MQLDAADQVKQIVGDLTPHLDSIGFHINSLRGPSEAGRLTISYDESTEVPRVLVAAIARVTQSDVDFVHERAVAIAALDADSLKQHQPWRSPKSLEQLLTERER